jgi:hypothetical protein
MSDLVVHIRHIRQAKLCTKGTRVWFAARGWSWSQFVAAGRPADDFIATGDPMALRPVEAARREADNGC